MQKYKIIHKFIHFSVDASLFLLYNIIQWIFMRTCKKRGARKQERIMKRHGCNDEKRSTRRGVLPAV